MTKKSDQEAMQNVVFRMTPDEIENLDNFADQMGLTRSQLIRNLVVVGMEETEIFKKLGLVRAVITVRDICSWMSHKVSQGISADLDKN